MQGYPPKREKAGLDVDDWLAHSRLLSEAWTPATAGHGQYAHANRMEQLSGGALLNMEHFRTEFAIFLVVNAFGQCSRTVELRHSSGMRRSITCQQRSAR